VSYTPSTDFVALMRQTPGGARTVEIPGLDVVVSALARAGLINLSVGQTAPTSNQSTTAWFKPAIPSWSAEGVLFLWNSTNGDYEVATPALWAQIFAATSSYLFQSVAGSSGIINGGTSLLAIQRNGPAATALTLPNLITQFMSGRRLQIVDFSTSVTLHTITLTTPDGATIMRGSSFTLLSTPDQLAGVMLQPSPDLNSWVIAP